MMPKAEKHTGSIGFEGASCFAADTGRVSNKKPQQITYIYPRLSKKFSKQKHTDEMQFVRIFIQLPWNTVLVPHRDRMEHFRKGLAVF